MPTATVSTTLSELNRLFGLYSEVADKMKPWSEQAQNAWSAYEAYVRKYSQERGLKITLERQVADSSTGDFTVLASNHVDRA